MSKLVAVKAYSVGGNVFWRSGKNWSPNGSVHMLEPTDLARLRQEARIVVVRVAESEAAIAEADSKDDSSDARLLEQSDARARRVSLRKMTAYTKQEPLRAHIEEVKADMAEDGTTASERGQLKDELNVLEQNLKHMIEVQKSAK
jgi:hypothetical protein